MNNYDIKTLRKLDHISFIDEMVKEYAVELKNVDRILRVKIFLDENGKYYAKSSYRIGTKPNASPYLSQEGNHDTIEAALFEAVSTSMTSFIHKETEHMIITNEHYYD